MAKPTAPESSETDLTPDAPRAGAASAAPRHRGVVSERARTGGLGAPEKRSTASLVVSVALHVVVGVALLELLTFGHGLSRFLGWNKQKPDVEERLTYVNTRQPKVPVKPTPTETQTPRLPAALSPNTLRFRAPTTGPVLGDPSPAAIATRADTGSGAGDGAKGVGALDPNLRGVRPGYSDVRVWRGQGSGSSGSGSVQRRTGAERLDSVMKYAITSVADSLDSLAMAQGKYVKKTAELDQDRCER